VSNSGSSDPDGSIVSTVINFGDGYIANGPSASHAYVNSGTFTVTVTVTDNNGATASAAATVNVTAAGVTIVKPVQNYHSTTTSVNVVANAVSSRPIASMIIYVDNVRAYSIYASSLNTNLIIKPGKHTILVKAWEDVTGRIYQNSVNISVK
jgi:PKD repeat protein